MQIIIDNIIGSQEIYLKILRSICGDTKDKSMVDLMCYHAPNTPYLEFKERTYVDVLDRKLDNQNEQQYFINSDVFDFLNNTDKHYDVSICSDGIEHLSKQKGIELLLLMGLDSDKRIIFTPLGDYMTTIETDTNPDSHKSGWLPEDFEGWATIVLPKFHPTLNVGAFFAFNCSNIESEFERVNNELKSII